MIFFKKLFKRKKESPSSNAFFEKIKSEMANQKEGNIFLYCLVAVLKKEGLKKADFIYHFEKGIDREAVYRNKRFQIMCVKTNFNLEEANALFIQYIDDRVDKERAMSIYSSREDDLSLKDYVYLMSEGKDIKNQLNDGEIDEMRNTIVETDKFIDGSYDKEIDEIKCLLDNDILSDLEDLDSKLEEAGEGELK